MTVLAAYQGNGFAVIGSDSRATDESGSMFVLANPKVTWDRQGKYLYAISGATRGGNLLQQGWTPPDAPAFIDIEHLDEFMTQTFIPSMRDVFIDAGYDAKDDGDFAWHDGSFLIAVNGIIYPIFSDYSWDRDIRNIYVGGSGGDIALGVMMALGIDKCKDNPTKAKSIIKKAIEIACEFNAFCATPVVIETQYKD
jgi:ATP-dependent protease HslVU (ClpYQ) peptidase subunit